MKLSLNLAKLFLQALSFDENDGLKILKEVNLINCCKEKECYSPHYAKGFCRNHYAKKVYHGEI